MANTRFPRSLPTPPATLPAYEPTAPLSSSPKPPVDSDPTVDFDLSEMPSPPYDKGALYTGNASFGGDIPCNENTAHIEDILYSKKNAPHVENTPFAEAAPVRLSAAQQLYASSFASRGPSLATLPPPTIDAASRRRVHEQPSFYKNQVSSYVPHSTSKARAPDSARSSAFQSTNTHVRPNIRPAGPQSSPYSGNSVSGRSLRPTPDARGFTSRSNNSSYSLGHAEPDRSMMTTNVPSFTQTSTYTMPQQTRNLFSTTRVDTVQPRELRNVTTAAKAPSGFEAPQSITSNVVKPLASAPLPPLPTYGRPNTLPVTSPPPPPPPAPVPLSPLQTGGHIHSLPVIVSPPPPSLSPLSPLHAPLSPPPVAGPAHSVPVLVSPPPPLPLSPNASQQFQPQHPAAPQSPGYLPPNMIPQRPPNMSPPIGVESNRSRTSRLIMDGINSLASSLGQLTVKSSVQSLLSGSSIQETIAENVVSAVGGDNSGGTGFIDLVGSDPSGLVSNGGDNAGFDYDVGLLSEDLATGMALQVPPYDASYGQDPSTSFSVTLPQFSVASGGTHYAPHNVNHTMNHAYTRQSHLPAGAQQPYSQTPQQPAYSPY